MKNRFKFFCQTLKKSSFGTHYLRFSESNKEVISLYPLTFNSQNYEHIFRLKKWRQRNKKFFSSKNNITYSSTNKYYSSYLNSKKPRLIFYIKYKKIFVGHFELTNLSNNNKDLEIKYILRGTKKCKGKMSEAIYLTSKFLIINFKFKNLFIKVEKNNLRAINFYKRINYIFYKNLNKILIFRFKNLKNKKKIEFRKILIK